MTTPSTASVPAPTVRDAAPVRLTLKPEGPTSGFVDGAWWPRSRDLAAEVPALLADLHDRLDHVERVTYHLSDWHLARRKVAVAGSAIRLGGFRTQHPDTVDVFDRHRRITLLVVPPETPVDAARRMMAMAASPGNADGIADLLVRGTSADVGAS